MNTIYKAILEVLSTGNKTSYEIATELGLSPAKMTALLSTLVSRQEVRKVGTVRSKGKDVMIYSNVENEDHKPKQSAHKDLAFEMARRLHQAWGGYLLGEIKPRKNRSSLKHRME